MMLLLLWYLLIEDGDVVATLGGPATTPPTPPPPPLVWAQKMHLANSCLEVPVDPGQSALLVVVWGGKHEALRCTLCAGWPREAKGRKGKEGRGARKSGIVYPQHM